MNNLVKALVAAAILGGIALVTLRSGGDTLDPGPGGGGSSPITDSSDGGANRTEPQFPPAAIDTFEVTGSVVDDLGSPLVGATVLVEKVGGSASLANYTAIDRVTTDAAGSFSSSLLTVGRFRFSASLSGYAGDSVLAAYAPGASPEPVRLVLTSGLTIEGVVRGPSGEPVPGAEVSALTEHFPPSSEDFITRVLQLTDFQEFKDEPAVYAETDAQGRYSIQGLEPNDYRITVAASGFGPGERRYVAAGSTGVDFSLEIGGQLLGVVTDEAGSPIAGATVRVFLQPDSQDVIDKIIDVSLPPIDIVETDSSGLYVFDTLGGDSHFRLAFDAPGYQRQMREKIVVTPGEQSRVDVALALGSSIRGVVYDTLGQPLAGARCRVNEVGVQQAGPPADFSDDSVETDQNGEFVFDTLRDVTHRLVVSHELYATYVGTRVQPSTEALTVQLTEGCMVRGVIFEEATGAPLEGAVVFVHGNGGEQKTGLSDSSGAYEVRGISETRRGTTFLNVEKEGYERIANFKVQIAEGTITEGIDHFLRKNGTVSGVVTDANGAPVAGVTVAARRSSQTGAVVVNVGQSATSGSDGRFMIEQVQPGSGTFLEGSHPEYLRTQGTQFSIAPGQQLAGQTLAMRLGGSISGRVVDESGTPIADAIVGAREGNLGTSSPSALPNKVFTDANGGFVLRRLEAGPQSLLIAAPGYLTVEDNRHEVYEGSDTGPIDIRLTAGAFLAGQVTNQLGEPIIGARVTVTDTSAGMNTLHATTDSNGMYRFDELGQYPVRVAAEAVGYGKVELNEQPVNSDYADIVLEAFGSISGAVYDDKGEPMRSFSVSPRLYDPNSGRPLTKVPPRTMQTSDGRFTFEGLEPGSYEVTIGAPAYAAEILENVLISSNEETVLPTISLNVGGRISGVVYDGVTSLGIPGATVTVVGGVRHFLEAPNSAPGTRGRRDQVLVREDGSFVIEGLKSSQVTLKIEHRLYMTEIYQDVRSGTENLEIPLNSGGTIEGVVTDEAGEFRPNVQILVKASEPGYDRRVVTDRRGYYSINGLPTGIYTLRVTDFGRPNQGKPSRDPGEAIAWEVEVIAGQTTILDLVD